MIEQQRHGIAPVETHDEAARESFVAALRKFSVAEMYPRIRDVYDGRIAPRFAEHHGHAPKDYTEARRAIEADEYFRAFTLINRATQELLWDTVGESVHRQLDELQARAGRVRRGLGTLTLDPGLGIPAHMDAVDIHVMPGNYHTELGEEDLYAGAMYDRGVFLYAYGGLGPLNDELGAEIAGFVRRQFPALQPRRILDMGCGVGLTTVPLKQAFPDAEVHGIDVSAPMLRYGHARAESLGQSVHFSQQDAVRTSFPDGHFDLIVSGLFLHELPMDVIRGVLREGHRLLSSGGVMAHHDMLGWPKEPFDDYMTDWNTLHNNEPFQPNSGRMDFLSACEEAGFSREEVFIGGQKAAYMEEMLEAVGLRGAVKR
jgi:SAM-dependent methyltransferase